MRARDFSHDIYQPVPIREISAEDRAEVRRWELRQALEERAKRERSERLGARVMRAAAVLVFIGALWAGWGIVRESMRAKAAPAVQPLPSVESLLRQGRVREALEVQEIHDAVVAQELMREAARD